MSTPNPPTFTPETLDSWLRARASDAGQTLTDYETNLLAVFRLTPDLHQEAVSVASLRQWFLTENGSRGLTQVVRASNTSTAMIRAVTKLLRDKNSDKGTVAFLMGILQQYAPGVIFDRLEHVEAILTQNAMLRLASVQAEDIRKGEGDAGEAFLQAQQEFEARLSSIQPFLDAANSANQRAAQAGESPDPALVTMAQDALRQLFTLPQTQTMISQVYETGKAEPITPADLSPELTRRIASLLTTRPRAEPAWVSHLTPFELRMPGTSALGTLVGVWEDANESDEELLASLKAMDGRSRADSLDTREQATEQAEKVVVRR